MMWRARLNISPNSIGTELLLLQKSNHSCVSVDFARLGISGDLNIKGHCMNRGRGVGKLKADGQLLGNHPYRVELPTYNFGRDYLSESGDENVQVSELLSGVENPGRFREIDSVLLIGFNDIDGMLHKKPSPLNTQTQLQPFHDISLCCFRY